MYSDGIILQFGTSRFLQAHADLFFHEAAEAGQTVLPVAVVQTSGSPARARRLAAFADPEGYPVIIRGLQSGQRVEREVRVKSIDQGLSTATDWSEVVQLFVLQACYVISNTGDAGYATGGGTSDDIYNIASPASSFPGKLAQLLYARFRTTRRPITILPCELISRNGSILKEIVAGIAARQSVEPDFLAWLDTHVIFANTLVDRIVSEPLEPAGAVAEPYALWAIEHIDGLALPCIHPSIMVVEDVEQIERLKLHILNLGHTVLAEIWHAEGRPADEFVREILADGSVRSRLLDVYRHEVLPGFAAKGLGPEAETYIETTLERFDNPFLDHRIADIASNHALKVNRRLAAFLEWSRTSAPTLEAIVAKYQRTSP